jgi:hypothetical protein
VAGASLCSTGIICILLLVVMIVIEISEIAFYTASSDTRRGARSPKSAVLHGACCAALVRRVTCVLG